MKNPLRYSALDVLLARLRVPLTYPYQSLPLIDAVDKCNKAQATVVDGRVVLTHLIIRDPKSDEATVV